MATNKKFRIQNGVDIHGGGLSIDDVTVIGADGKVVESAIADAVAGLTSSDIADLQAQVSAILGTSPETLDTLQEIVTAFENADSSLTASVAANTAAHEANSASISATNARTAGISTDAGSSNVKVTADLDMDGNKVTNVGAPTDSSDAATKAYVDAVQVSGSGDLSAETAARIAGDATTASDAAADATSKADAAEAAAVATASADATSKANAAQAAAEATASADATSKADAAEASAKAHADSGDSVVQAAVDVVSGRVDAILNGAGESLDTIVEVVAAFENADSDLQTLITSNATAVSTETARAQAAESGLQSSIDSLTSSTSGDVSGLQGQIDDEEAARIAGDASLQSQLNAEISRATSAEAVNAANIASEITARSNADAAIEADVVALQNQVGTILGGAPGTLDTFVEIINAFEGADSDLQTVISSNSTRLTTAENNITALEADLTAEENARASGDSALQAQITANDTDIASNAAAISAEETRASAAESGLQAQITSNDADIAALQTRAGTIEGKDADQDVAIAANAAAISAEESRAVAAEGVIASDLATEVSRAQTAEAALQSSIDFVKQNTDPAALDSLTEIVAAFQAADGSITSVVNSNTTRISALEGSVTGIEAWNTDNVSEGSTNLYFTEARAKACVGADANSCIDYDEASGKFSLDISETEGALVPDNATNADQLDGQHGDYYRINIYNVAGTLVN